MATEPSFLAVARKPTAVVLLSCANDCEPYAVAPLATMVAAAPFTPISVPALAPTPVAVVSRPFELPMADAATDVTD